MSEAAAVPHAAAQTAAATAVSVFLRVMFVSGGVELLPTPDTMGRSTDFFAIRKNSMDALFRGLWAFSLQSAPFPQKAIFDFCKVQDISWELFLLSRNAEGADPSIDASE